VTANGDNGTATRARSDRRGPLAGIRILEVGGIGPAPFAGMMLADLGADVLRVDRSRKAADRAATDPTLRGRQTIVADLKSEEGRALVLRLAERADALIEGFRPGVMERLGLGPADLEARNPRLVYARMTGWGQDGPLAQVAGHDINYISVAGALGSIRRAGERPMFPLNLLGDYGGGALFLAFGVVCGVLETRTSGRGQVVDVAMVDGVNLLTAGIHMLRRSGLWEGPPGTNLLDGGAHFYEVYETADGGHVAVGAIEPQFYARLLELLGLSADEFPQWDRERWPELKERFAGIFRTRTTAEWRELLEQEDACATAVRHIFDAAEHPHMKARGSHVELNGVLQPAPAPRFSRTPGAARPPENDPDAALQRWGISEEDRCRLRPEPVAGAVT
jgi:alpha-methylacyl-CoA racemase